VSDQDQLRWEARFAVPAAIAAFAGGFLLLAGTFVLQSMIEDREPVEALPDFLLSINDAPGTLLFSSALQAVSSLCLVAVFFYLFRATVHRGGQIPSWFVYMILIGPIFFAASKIVGAIDQIDVAERFAEQTSSIEECPAIRGDAGDKCADALLQDSVNPIGVALSLAGSVATAFLFVMLPLRARRAGLLSQFMAILGVIAGAFLVLRLMPLVPEVLQAFWLGAIGALFLGRWPGGRGPAWETGQPDPWPSAAERRGLVPAGGGEEEPAEPSRGASNGGGAEPEEAPARPKSRKRRRR
jgi:hypothetical protein